MPKKPNHAGKMQEYVPAGNGDASGEYGDSGGSNKHFKAFKKPKSVKPLKAKEKIKKTLDDDLKKAYQKYGNDEDSILDELRANQKDYNISNSDLQAVVEAYVLMAGLNK